MFLLWHIIKTDLRRLWPWFALIVASIVVRYSLVWSFAHRLDLDRPAFDRAAEIDFFLFGLLYLLLALFVVAVLHEDSPLDTRAFWPTLPIAGRRLLTAKLFIVVLGVILLPIAGTLVWWWLHDFRPCDLLASLPHALTRLTIFTAITTALVIFNRSWFGFVLTVAATAALLAALHHYYQEISPRFPGELGLTRLTLAVACLSAGLTISAHILYQHRRLGRLYTTLAATLFLTLAISVAWPWEFPSRYRFSGAPPMPAAPDTSSIQAAPLSSSDVQIFTNDGTLTHQELHIDLAGLPENHIAAVRSARPIERAPGVSIYCPFRPTLQRSAPEPTPQSVTFTVRTRASDQALRWIPDGNDVAISLILRRIAPIAIANAVAGQHDHTGPYHLRILNPSAPNRDAQNWNKSRAVSCLLIHPSHLTAPGTGVAEYCGTPDDTDESGGHFAERATLFATREDRPLAIETDYPLTFSVDGIFFVRRSLSLEQPITDLSTLKIHYVTYPAVGTFQRTVAFPPRSALP